MNELKLTVSPGLGSGGSAFAPSTRSRSSCQAWAIGSVWHAQSSTLRIGTMLFKRASKYDQLIDLNLHFRGKLVTATAESPCIAGVNLALSQDLIQALSASGCNDFLMRVALTSPSSEISSTMKTRPSMPASMMLCGMSSGGRFRSRGCLVAAA